MKRRITIRTQALKLIKPDDDTLSGSSFLVNAVEDVVNFTSVSEELYPDRKWFFVEISQGPKFMLQKIWQIERAVRILTRIDPSYAPKAVAILFNGSKDDYNLAINKLDLPDTLLIKKYPLYIGWVHTRNIFNSFSELKSLYTKQAEKTSELKGLVEKQSETTSALTQSFSELKIFVEKQSEKTSELKGSVLKQVRTTNIFLGIGLVLLITPYATILISP